MKIRPPNGLTPSRFYAPGPAGSLQPTIPDVFIQTQDRHDPEDSDHDLDLHRQNHVSPPALEALAQLSGIS